MVTAISVISSPVGLRLSDMRLPLSRRLTQPRAGWFVARGHREPRPAYSPEGYCIRQATRPKPVPVFAARVRTPHHDQD